MGIYNGKIIIKREIFIMKNGHIFKYFYVYHVQLVTTSFILL